MIKPLLSFALCALLVPVAAHAAVINIAYTGHVSFIEGTGLGYSIGDAVTGHVQIDLNKAMGFNTPADNVANYYVAADQHDLISGYHTTARGNSSDMVDVYDGAYEHEGSFDDFLYTSDTDTEFSLDEYFNFTSNVYSMYLKVLLPGVDWLDVNNLVNLNVDITDSAALAASSGQIYNIFAAGRFMDYTVHADVAQFTFNSLQITASDTPSTGAITKVPETNSLWLLMVAFVGLLAGRSRHKSVRN